MKVVGLTLGIVVALIGLFLFGYTWRDIKSRQAPSTEALAKLVGINHSGKAEAAKIFKDSYDQILASYYRKIDPKQLKFAGMSGLVNALGDPHTLFMQPVEAKGFAEDTRGSFGGIGARLGPDPMGARVAVIFDDGPAIKAGMKQNDLITHVNGKAVGGIPVDDIVSKVRGPIGEYVRLTLVRAGQTKPIQIKVKRAKIITPTVEGRVLPNTKVGYVAVSIFAEPTANQFASTLDKLERSGINGLVIDLRGNPGGLLETASDMLSQFISNKQVVTIRLRGGREEVVRSQSGLVRNMSYPIVVLIDQDSASASEIFAGVLQDYRLATLVGEHTYGKASVQNVFPLIDGSSAKITIAKYILPGQEEITRKIDEDGQYISGGLRPDYEAPLNLDKNPIMGDPKSDNQLQKALEIIKKRAGGAQVLNEVDQPFANTLVA